MKAVPKLIKLLREWTRNDGIEEHKPALYDAILVDEESYDMKCHHLESKPLDGGQLAALAGVEVHQ